MQLTAKLQERSRKREEAWDKWHAEYREQIKSQQKEWEAAQDEERRKHLSKPKIIEAKK